MRCEFKTSSNPCFEVMVEFHSNSFVRQVTTLTLIVRPNPYSGAPFNQCLIAYVSSSIHHYTIWSDKCYLLVHIIVEIHLLLTSMNCRWFHQPPPHPLLSLMMNSCFGPHSHSSFPENLAMSFRWFVLRLFFSDILSLRHHDTNWIWISVRYNGGTTFQELCCLSFDDPVTWCHA